MDEAKLEALAEWHASTAFGDGDRAALAFADAMTATPAAVSDALWEELRRHFDERQIVELASAIAWENHRARFNRAFLVEAEGFSRGAYCPLPVGTTPKV